MAGPPGYTEHRLPDGSVQYYPPTSANTVLFGNATTPGLSEAAAAFNAANPNADWANMQTPTPWVQTIGGLGGLGGANGAGGQPPSGQPPQGGPSDNWQDQWNQMQSRWQDQQAQQQQQWQTNFQAMQDQLHNWPAPVGQSGQQPWQGFNQGSPVYRPNGNPRDSKQPVNGFQGQWGNTSPFKATF